MTTDAAYEQKRRAEKPWRQWYRSREWFRLRAEIIRRDSAQLSDGRVVPRCRATGAILIGKHPAPDSPTVDHIKPHRGDSGLFWDPSNLWTISKAFHDSQKQKWENAAKKPQIGPDGWPVETASPKQ